MYLAHIQGPISSIEAIRPGAIVGASRTEQYLWGHADLDASGSSAQMPSSLIA
jgi:hypothetical protein